MLVNQATRFSGAFVVTLSLSAFAAGESFAQIRFGAIKSQSLQNMIKQQTRPQLKPQFKVPKDFGKVTIDPNAINGLNLGNQNGRQPNGNAGGNGGAGGNAGGNQPGQGNQNRNPDWRDIVDAVGDILHGPNNNGNQNGNQGGQQGNHNGRPGGNHNGHWDHGHWNQGHHGWYSDPIIVQPAPINGGVIIDDGGYGSSSPISNSVPSNSIPSNALPNSSNLNRRSGTIVSNPDDTNGTVRFSIDGRSYQLKPGFQQALPSGAQRTIRFDRGGNYGIARYSLSEGVYEFRVTDRGWNIVRKSFTVDIVNNTDHDFRYVADGKLATAKPQRVMKHKSRFPVVIGFDRGDGGKPAVMTLKTGTYHVGLHSESGLWDLSEESPAQLAASE